MNYESHSSFKHKIRNSSCFSCCFRSSAAGDLDYQQQQSPSLIRSSSQWIRSKARNEIPEIKEKCISFASRVGGRHHRRAQSADYRYDPLSYALNFDDGNGVNDLEIVDQDEFRRQRNFSSRLPATPPQAAAATATVGVACS